MTNPALFTLHSPLRDSLPPVATDLLGPFFDIGAFGPTEAHLTSIIARLVPEVDPLSLLALVVASRGARLGHTCINLDVDGPSDTEWGSITGASGRSPALQWPNTQEWLDLLTVSPIVATPDSGSTEPLRPLVLDGRRIYLQRYWLHEVQVAEVLGRYRPAAGSTEAIEATLDLLFADARGRGHESTDQVSPADQGDNTQRRAAGLALNGGLSIITGGPGTGKTFTIARILAGAHYLATLEGKSFSAALAAPTGKAAARITESLHIAFESLADLLPSSPVIPESATTIHTLLGWATGDRFRHNRHNPLPHDLVIIDETSMVSLSLMASLLEAVKPTATLVLVGDPDQLASIEVGTVLSDIIGPAGRPAGDSRSPAAVTSSEKSSLTDRITVLTRTHRFDDESEIAELAEAVRNGDIDAALVVLARGGRVEWVKSDDSLGVSRVVHEVVEPSIRVAEAALLGDSTTAMAAASSVKVLAATRSRPFGVDHWSELIESAVVDRVAGVNNTRPWFVGRPVIVTSNDRMNRIANGDVGIVVANGNSMTVALPDADGFRHLPTSRLAEVDTWWAMTIHKSQGSEFDHVVVSLPPSGSPVLSRELLYTGITRARQRVTILADESSLRVAIERTVTRASGLRSRLWTSSA